MNARRFARFLAFAAPLALLLQGCAVHAHHGYYGYDDYGYDDYDETGYVEPAPSYGYYGGHVIPDVYGGGWCFLEGSHYHEYAPDYLGYYRFRAGFYVYTGPVSFFFFGFHPVPVIYGGGYCHLAGRHVHHYHPNFAPYWRYHPTRRYYYWSDGGRPPARGWHPAEPAYRDHHPRVHDVRPARDRPAPGMVARPARPATRSAPGDGRPPSGRAAPSDPRAGRRPAPGDLPGDAVTTPSPGRAPNCDALGRCVDPQPTRGRDDLPAHRGGRPAEADPTVRGRTVLDLGPVEGTGRPSVGREPDVREGTARPTDEERWGRGRLTPAEPAGRTSTPGLDDARPGRRAPDGLSPASPSGPARAEPDAADRGSRFSRPTPAERPSAPSRMDRRSTPPGDPRVERPAGPSRSAPESTRAQRPAPSRVERPSPPSRPSPSPRVDRPSATPRAQPSTSSRGSSRSDRATSGRSSRSKPRASERRSSKSDSRASERRSSSSRSRDTARSPSSRRSSRASSSSSSSRSSRSSRSSSRSRR